MRRLLLTLTVLAIASGAGIGTGTGRASETPRLEDAKVQYAIGVSGHMDAQGRHLELPSNGQARAVGQRRGRDAQG
jgi:hypothetical protein